MKFFSLQYWIFSALLVLTINVSVGQNYGDKEYCLIDSLDLDRLSSSDSRLIHTNLAHYHASKVDTSRLEFINIIVEESWDEKVWPPYNEWVLHATELLLTKTEEFTDEKVASLQYCLANALNNKGLYYNDIGRVQEGIVYYDRSLKIQRELGELKGVAYTLNNLGYVYKNQGNITKALDYYSESLKLCEKINDQMGIALAYNNIGLIYHNQGDIPEALDYYLKSLKIHKELDKKQGLAYCYHNVGAVYEDQFDTIKALEYYKKGLVIRQEIGDRIGEAISITHIARVNHALGNVELAISQYKNGLDISSSIEDVQGEASYLNALAEVYIETGKLAEAKSLALKSFAISNKLGFPEEIRNSALNLSVLYKKEKNYMSALQMFQLYSTMKDSIFSEKTHDVSSKNRLNYEYEKQKAIEDKENEKILALKEEEKNKQEIISIASGIGVLMFLIASIIIFNRLRVTKEQKHIIEETNEELNQTNEEILAISDKLETQNTQLNYKNAEILSSITYAKRIQEAILPSEEKINSMFKESFVLYRPKDIVSGDFYWFEQLNNKVFWAAVDCTGHGVPGAFMSILGYNGLKKILLERKVTTPSEILEQLTEHITDSIRETQKGEQVKDGMDIALCSLDLDSMELEYCGAYNPLYILRNGEIQITKGTKRPVGIFMRRSIPDFVNHKIQLQKNDVVYIFTDGYADQFGGPDLAAGGKKFSYHRMRELLIQSSHEFDTQRDVLDKEYVKWKGSQQQIDDVCVIGIKV